MKDRIKVICEVCSKEEMVLPSRVKRYKTCSYECMGKRTYNRLKKRTNVECEVCKFLFEVKNSHINRRRYCSKICQAKAYEKRYLGQNNPNFKNSFLDFSGYRVEYKDVGRVNVHRDIAKEVLGLTKLPKGYVVHHKDCNKINNIPENLILLTNSDHEWLHKQFGSAVLWAYENKKISLDILCEWSTNKEKTNKLLSNNLLTQKQFVLSGSFTEF